MLPTCASISIYRVSHRFRLFWNCSRVGTFGTESAVRKRGGSRNLPYWDAKPRQIPLLGTYAWTVTLVCNSVSFCRHICPSLLIWIEKNAHRYFIMEKSAIQILLRSSLFSYAATAVFLLLLAFGMYRFQWGEKTAAISWPYVWFCSKIIII